MNKAIEIMVTEAIAKLAQIHNCEISDIMTGIMTGNELIANQLTELIGAAEAAIAKAIA